jgi:hypothetical protein
MIERRAFLRWLGSVAGGLCLSCDFRRADTHEGPPYSPGMGICVLEDAFGRVEIDLVHPALKRLYLRQSGGRLGTKSLLSEHASDFPNWAVGGASYLVGKGGHRYEARLSTAHRWRSDARSKSLYIEGINLRTAEGTTLPCTESWSLCLTKEGGLRWEIRRRFEQPFTALCHGGPALFFNISPNAKSIPAHVQRRNAAGNGVAINWWVSADALNGESLASYRQFPIPIASDEWFLPKNSLTMLSRDGWAIFKLYTCFAHDQDLRIQSAGGHLYRRGMFYGFQEVGVTAGPSAGYQYERGQQINLAIELVPVPQLESGQQLMLRIPDAKMETALKSYFSGLANAGCLVDCDRHLLGNQCDGFFYAGNMHWHAYSLLASCPKPSPVSSAPISYPEVFRKTLTSNLQSVDDRGEVMSGYRHENAFPELSMMNLIGLEAYLLYSGDVDFAKGYASTIERLDTYLEGWLKDGLFYAPWERIRVPNQFINWYYDIVIGAHGYTMYHNVNCVRALMALETIYAALEEAERAHACTERRQSLISRINEVFWDDSVYGPGHGGYVDWIREDGQKRACFFACNQYPAILFGIASPEQARIMLATADERIKVLKRYFGYRGDGTLDNLWPLHDGDIRRDFHRFGGLCNGGMLVAMTFWEVAARCQAHDPDGAYHLLKNFSKHAAKTNWFEGANGFLMTGEPAFPFYEPFLADGLVAAAGVVHGFLGLRYSWQRFTVTPHLPSGWDKISARIMFKAVPYTIRAGASGDVLITRTV